MNYLDRCPLCKSRNIALDGELCFTCEQRVNSHKREVKYKPDNMHYCTSPDCPKRGEQFMARDMKQYRKYLFCSINCMKKMDSYLKERG